MIRTIKIVSALEESVVLQEAQIPYRGENRIEPEVDIRSALEDSGPEDGY